MALDPSIILRGQPLDVVGAMRQGNAAAMETNALRQQNQLADVYRTQGAGLLAGDQGAFNALAGIAPDQAFNMRGAQQDYAMNARKMEILNAEEKRQIAAAAAQMDAAQKEAAIEQTRQSVFQMIAAPTPEAFDQMAQAAGKPELVGQFANRKMLGAQYITEVSDLFKLVDGAGRPAPLTDQGKLAADMQNGWVTPEQANAPAPVDQKAATDIRKEFAGLQPIKNFAVQSDAYAKVVSAAKDPSAAGDLALIFSFMKMLDPTSVVREQEFANAQNAAGVPERLRAAYNNVLTGERLTPSTRADFLSQTQAIYSGAEQEYANIEKQYRGLAERQGIPLEDALIDFRYSGPKYTPPVAMRDLARAGITGQGAPAQPTPSQSGPIVIDGYTIEAIE